MRAKEFAEMCYLEMATYEAFYENKKIRKV